MPSSKQQPELSISVKTDPSRSLLTRRNLLAASAINGFGFILVTVSNILWYYLIVRNYSGVESGNLLLAMSVAGMINLLDLGTSMGLTRMISMNELPSHRNLAVTAFQSSILVGLSLQFAVGSAAVFIWASLANSDASLWTCGAIIVFAVSTQAVLLCVSALKGLCDFKASNLVSTFSASLVYGTGAALAAFGNNVWLVFITMSIVQMLVGVVAIQFTHGRFRTYNWVYPDASKLVRSYISLLRSSLAFAPQMMTGIFFMHAQRFIIARYSGIESVAIVSFAYSVATRIHSLVNAFLEVIFPLAAKLREQGHGGFFILKIGLISALSYMMMATFIVIVAHFIVPEFQLTFGVFALGGAFAIAAAPAFHLLNGNGASLLVSISSFISPFLFVVAAEVIYLAFQPLGNLLLPTAYAITMATMLALVSILAWCHLRSYSH